MARDDYYIIPYYTKYSICIVLYKIREPGIRIIFVLCHYYICRNSYVTTLHIPTLQYCTVRCTRTRTAYVYLELDGCVSGTRQADVGRREIHSTHSTQYMATRQHHTWQCHSSSLPHSIQLQALPSSLVKVRAAALFSLWAPWSLSARRGPRKNPTFLLVPQGKYNRKYNTKYNTNTYYTKYKRSICVLIIPDYGCRRSVCKRFHGACRRHV